MTENRRHERVPSEFLVRIRVRDSDELTEGQALNLSGGGAFVRSDAPLPRGTQVKLELNLEPIGKVAYVEGTVVWTRPKMPDPQFPSGMGIRFDEPDDEALRHITETIEALARRRRSKGGSPPDEGSSG